MGKEARSIDTVADVRKHIGEAAASMLEKVRADYRKQALENVALARECIALREAVGAALAMFEEPRKAYKGTLERLDNVKGRVDRLSDRMACVQHGPETVAGLERLRVQILEERNTLAVGRLAWLPWRRRRVQDLSRFLGLLVAVRQPNGQAFERANPQQVVE